MLNLTKRPLYITGVAETPLGKVTDISQMGMFALAAREALQEAGMTLADVGGLWAPWQATMSSTAVAEYLGITPKYLESSDHGGSQFLANVCHAMAVIDAGIIDVALIGFASRQRSMRSRPSNSSAFFGESLTTEFEGSLGLPMPIGHFALAMDRHMYEYGTKREAFAEVAVAARQWAQLNPKAWHYGKPITREEVLASRPLCEPLTKEEMCLVTDGGGVMVVTNAARSTDAAKKPVRILGAAEAMTHYHVWMSPDITRWAGEKSAKEALRMAGVTPDDIDVFEPYDASTPAVNIQIGDVGFVDRTDVGDFVLEGNLAPGGRLPSMTSGGGLAHNHPGAFGMQIMVESVRQARGEAGLRQVDNARIVMAHGLGGIYSNGASVVMSCD